MVPPYYPQQDVISLIVRIERGRVAEVMHVARTQVQAKLEGEKTPFIAYLRGDKGETLAEAPLLRLPQQVSGDCGPRAEDDPCACYLAQAFVPDLGRGMARPVHPLAMRWSSFTPALLFPAPERLTASLGGAPHSSR